MNVGDEATVSLMKKIKDNVYIVTNTQTGEEGLLSVKGRLKVSKDNTVNVWVIRYDKTKEKYVYGNAYFGKFSISAGISEKYIKIIDLLYTDDSKITDADISQLKGMVNRCLKRDQWDWYTTFEYIGYPASKVMHEFVHDSFYLRNELREGHRENLPAYKEKFYYIFNSMMYHLGAKLEDKVDDYIVPIKSFDKELWNKLSYDSKKNIKMLEHLENSTSIYILMHYFVTLEQEFFNHLVSPFVERYKEELKTATCNDRYLTTTHEILTGKTHFSLGSIFHLGKNVIDKNSRRKSIAIDKYAQFLGEDIYQFVDICNMIGNTRIGNLTLTNMRNGLAHGNAELINQIDKNAYYKLRSFLLEAPDSVVVRVLTISKK